MRIVIKHGIAGDRQVLRLNAQERTTLRRAAEIAERCRGVKGLDDDVARAAASIVVGVDDLLSGDAELYS